MNSNSQMKGRSCAKPVTSSFQTHQPQNTSILSKSGTTYPIGLKNIGNTCFLNTTIQFLFSASKFKTTLIKQASKNITTFSALIGKLFTFLEEKSKEKDKIREVLEKMVKQIESMNLQYSCYSQEDALETLLNILFEIQDSHPQILQNFEVQCKVECACQSNIVADKVLLYQAMTCAQCRKTIKRTIMNYPPYIIYTNSNKISVSKQLIQMAELDSQAFELIYRLKSQIVYLGNGLSGHYFARRHEDDSSYILNDEYVGQINAKNAQYYEGNTKTGLILLYQLREKRKISKKDSRNSFEKSKEIATKPQALSYCFNDVSSSDSKYKERSMEQQSIFHQQQPSLRLVQNGKIDLSSVYCLKISVIDKMSLSDSARVTISYAKKLCYVRIFHKGGIYDYQILNKEQFPYYSGNSQAFDHFYYYQIRPKQNQLELFGAYLQSYLINSFLECCNVFANKRPNNDHRKPKDEPKQFASSLFYEVQRNPS